MRIKRKVALLALRAHRTRPRPFACGLAYDPGNLLFDSNVRRDKWNKAVAGEYSANRSKSIARAEREVEVLTARRWPLLSGVRMFGQLFELLEQGTPGGTPLLPQENLAAN